MGALAAASDINVKHETTEEPDRREDVVRRNRMVAMCGGRVDGG
jgi:hypothetical protein